MKEFKKYFIIPAPPEELYIALTNPLTIQLWTGEAAEMTIKPDSEFSLWNGSIVGKNLAFETDRKIEQEWYFDNDEAKSIVTILLHPHKKGTSMEVKHTNIPDEDFDAIAEGWEEIYVGSLIDFYEHGE